MATIIESELKAGVIYGDTINDEYVYMPGSEVGVGDPICIYENQGQQEDVHLPQALDIVRLRSLKPTKHPRLGRTSY